MNVDPIPQVQVNIEQPPVIEITVAPSVNYSGSVTLIAPTVKLVAAVDLGGHRVLAVDYNGKAIYADSLNQAHLNRIIGISTTAVSIGNPIEIVTSGFIEEPSWNWDITMGIFLSNNGLLTQVVPIAGVIQRVGFPVTPTKISVSITTPILL